MMTVTDFENMQNFFESGATRPYLFRKSQLQLLQSSIKKYEQQISEALYKDLRKNELEAYTTEIGFLYSEIKYTLKNLQNWMYPQTVPTPMVLQPSTSKIIRDALGISLIIAPWNYPFQLTIGPLIGAIAGGNCAVLKPSEFTPNTTEIIKKIIEETFPSNYVFFVEGDGAKVVPALLNENNFNHIFFTGSVAVGKEIAKLAATKLIPTTLELGGKSPCIVDDSANIKVAAQRIIWGKFTNAGQTCVAPDYVLVQENCKSELLKQIKLSIEKYYTQNPQQSPDYGRIVNEKRWEKLNNYLSNGTVIHGGKTDKADLYIEPTLIDVADSNIEIMQDEIFGPILPILTYKTKEEALNIVKQHSNPLSLYVFTGNKKVASFFTENLAFGGGCINNTIMHLANPDLPFGGVGNSGLGQYHGQYTFEAFTRPKSILQTATWIDPSIKYPPYKGMLKYLKWLIK